MVGQSRKKVFVRESREDTGGSIGRGKSGMERQGRSRRSKKG